MKINDIRIMFLNFFKEKKHTYIKSSSLIPKNDNTLLFTNSGMNQFKNIFLGKIKPKQKSVTSIQYCIRTGGKHNDLKKVGYTNYHHTLFEMLGNFSFGEYFKKESILYAWEFLTSKKWINLPKEKLFVTYYYNDLESYKIWSKILKKKNIIPIYDKNNIQYNSDNFWKMGETGPCGPCTEIFYDQGSYIPGNLPGSKKYFGERYIEIWNIVFIQFNQIKKNKLIKIPIPSVDTGMGLERIAAILQKVTSTYKTDNFKNLIKSIKKTLSIKNKDKISLRVIADHIRTISCLISENISPGNEGRNYVVRRIIRRALIHGYFLGIRLPFLYKLPKFLLKSMKEISIFFNISEKIKKIEKILKNEEKQFYIILKKSIKILLKEIKILKKKEISAKKVFYLYDTYGLPLEITQNICKKNNININYIMLKKIIKNRKKQQKKQKKSKIIKSYPYLKNINKKSIFNGYENYKQKSKIIQIIYYNESVSHISKEKKGILVLDITPFYSKSSGQISDSGKIKNENATFIVEKVKKYKNYIGHIGKLKNGTLYLNDLVYSKINQKKRESIQSNHTATHLLHASLKKILGKSIYQTGSLISDKYLRFDFFYQYPIKKKEINAIEILINKKIQKNIPVTSIITSIKKAKKYNAIAQFTKKYKKIVRMIQINNFSIELCSGTHQLYTGNIGCFKIISLNNIGHENKRITAITGKHVVQYIQQKEKIEEKIQKILKTDKKNIHNNLTKILKKIDNLKIENKYLKKEKILNLSKKIISHAYLIKNIYIITYLLYENHHDILNNIYKIIKQKLKSVIIILFNCYQSRIIFNINVTKDLTNQLNALEIMKKIFSIIPGKGGGKKNITKGKLNNTINIVDNLEKIKLWVIKNI